MADRRCRHVRRWLAENLPAEAEAMTPPVREHVARCTACCGAWRRLLAVARSVAGLPQPSTPADLRAQVMAAIDQRAAKRSAWRPVILARPAWAAVAVVALCGVLATGQLSRPTIIAASPTDLRPASYVQQHTAVEASDPLADATMLHAMGSLALRSEVRGDSPVSSD